MSALSELRENAMMSQDELAKKSRVSKRQISRIENGDFEDFPRMSTLRKLAEALGCNALELQKRLREELEHGITTG